MLERKPSLEKLEKKDDLSQMKAGDYRNAWTDAQGRRRSHIIDPL